MNKTIAWGSIILFSLVAAYLLLNRSPIQKEQPLFIFTKPHIYAISYPRGWFWEDTGRTSGYEILSLYSYDYRNTGNTDDVFGPGQIKIALSILDKGSKSLVQIADSEFPGPSTDYRKEILNIKGHQALRISRISVISQGPPSPKVEMFIDYRDNQYALLAGYYDGDKDAAGMIDKIQESFTVLK